MAGSVNKVILIGRLGKDPEVRNTQGGQKIVNMAVATEESWNDRASGERKKRTEWHRVVIFNDRLAESAERYLKKGSLIYVEGQLQTRKWTDNSGVEKYTTEVVLPQFGAVLTFLESASDGENGGGGPPRSGAQQWDRGGSSGGAQSRTQTGARGRQGSFERPGADLDDEVPF